MSAGRAGDGGSEDAYRWMTCADAADELGTTLRELYRAIDAGRLSAYRIDAQIRLRRHEVERFSRELHPSGG